MKWQMVALSALVALSTLVPGLALANDTLIYKRCEEDSLDPAQARERVAWYAKNYPEEIVSQARAVTGRNPTLEQALGWYNRYMLEDPVFGGPAERPSYPTFVLADYTNPDPKYFAPKDANGPANKPANYLWLGTCLSSCYKPGVEVLFAGDGGEFKSVAIDLAMKQSISKVATLSEESTLEWPQLTSHEVAFYTESITETDHDIFDLIMASGGELKVTANHPLVDSTGHIREARTFEIGDKLMRADGTQDPIASISYEAFHGRVYNVASREASLLGQVVVANGYLNGSAWYQNAGLRNLNRGLLRSSLPADVLE